METYYNIHNIVKIKIRTKNPRIIKEYENKLRHFKLREEAENTNTDIEIRDFDEFLLPKEHFDISNDFYGFKNGIYHKRDSQAVKLENNKMLIYIKGADISLFPLIEYFLLKNNCTFIHAAGISYKDQGIIFPAGPGAGKTLLISRLRQKSEVKFFGDDYLILKDNAVMYSFPIDFSIYNYHFNFFDELKKSAESKKIKRAKYEKPIVNVVKNLPLKKTLKKIAYFLKYDFPKGGEYVKIPVQWLVSKEKIGKSAVLKYSLFLSRYNGNEFKTEKMKLENLVRIGSAILQDEWRKTMPICYSLSLSNVLDFTDYLNDIRNTFSKCFSNLELYKVLISKTMDNREYIKKLEQFLEQEIFNSM